MSRSSWFESETPLDHDMVVDDNGVIHVVVGNEHPLDTLHVYPKYEPTLEKTLWCNRITCYRRIPSYYEVLHIYSKSKKLVREYYDPKYGTSIIGLKTTSIRKVFHAWERLKKIITSPKSYLETVLVELVDDLRGIGIPTISLGVTGSILIGIHNDRVSDIDLVVYGEAEALRAVEALEAVLEPLSGKYLHEWVENHSRAYSLPRELVEKYYAVWRRGLYKGRVTSIIYVNPQVRIDNYYSEIHYYLGPARLIVNVEPYQVSSLFYPSRARARVVEVEHGKRVNDDIIIISYESLYSKPLFQGGRMIVEGALYNVKGVDEYIELLVGVREHRGFIRILKPL